VVVAVQEIDVRTIVPRERRPLIFSTFDGLQPGESFLLINDHDPKPLFYQLQAEREGQVVWEPQEEGPERWVIRLGKAASVVLPTQPLRDEHRELLPQVDEIRALAEQAEASPSEVLWRLDVVLEFLQGQLLIHAGAEEQVLYPVIAALLGGSEATATMSHDHIEIGRFASELAGLREAFAGGSPTSADRESVRRLGYGLYAMTQLHFEKEEEVYLPLLDAELSVEQAGELFGAMEHAAGELRAAG
jgi:uncharacterized protein (DUF2249 family)/iron-sulfur cluster repair protein YtfE (RIC family)